MVERNRPVVASIAPPERTVAAAQALAAMRPVMTQDQAAAWQRDSRETFDEAVRDAMIFDGCIRPGSPAA